ncbi:hypothetical protein CCR85_14660 [Rhodothalassium salexigens]|uniref:DUF2336 domain-containing protein n=1 Tax=Rhodothalassium salexigens TaxID=1086 RepID=UPI001912ACF5|nr:DUF2336 domain-containing protein [Rhodothalassium salexigens]MBK5912722.1 hypothetical protein [Rhodothalassium salexigens]
MRELGVVSSMGQARDIFTTITEAAAADREALARRLGRYLTVDGARVDRQAAIGIAEALAHDLSVAVRAALAEAVAASEILPARLVDVLSRDVPEVSLPFIRHSPTLTDRQLAALVYDGDPAVQTAVASRASVSEPLSHMLSEHGAEPAVRALVDNDGSVMSSRVCGRILDRFPQTETLLSALSRRGDLPVDAVEPLLERLSDAAREALVVRFDLGRDYATYLAESARRRVLGNTLDSAPVSNIVAYLAHLHEVGELDLDMLLHLVRNGNLRSFAVAVGVFVDVDPAWVLSDLDARGVAALVRYLRMADIGPASIRLLADSYDDYLTMTEQSRAC